ncbi:MAG: hypothetical protein MRJ92_01550 [Nitrospira sp.]|nr:hypothetical protein [Nitrospira sp.]
MSVVQPIPATDPFSLFPLQDWTGIAIRSAEDLVRTARRLGDEQPVYGRDR